LPSYAELTDGKTADIKAAKSMTFAPGTMLVFDRGYSDYNWWLQLTR
jgi:putative transposase